MITAKKAALAGAFVLLATSAFHLTGLPLAEAAKAEISSTFFSSSLVSLWLLPSVHWAFIALLAASAAWHPCRFSRFFLHMAALVLLIDAGMMLASIGPFVAQAMLAAAAVLFVATAKLSPVTD